MGFLVDRFCAAALRIADSGNGSYLAHGHMAHHVVGPYIDNTCSACDDHVVCLYDVEAHFVWADLQSPALEHGDHCGSLDMQNRWILWRVHVDAGQQAVWEDPQAP